jgi:metal-responsive CopG/Arc/MetJ family transcriptional regulator
MRIHAMTEPARIQVLLPKTEAERFDAYCRRKGFKKSTLIARLVREYLDKENGDFPKSGQPLKSRNPEGSR